VVEGWVSVRMYSHKITQRDIQDLERGFLLQNGAVLRLIRFSVDECRRRVGEIESLLTDGNSLSRPLTEEEEAFVQNEMLLCSVDFRYWFERYCFIEADDAFGGKRLATLWGSQALILERISAIEEEMWEQYEEQVRRGYDTSIIRVNGICIVLLKARQLGATTLCQAIIVHRLIFWTDLLAITASADDTKTQKVMDKAVRMYDSLPFWMQPEMGSKVKDVGLKFPELNTDYYQQHAKQISGMGQGSTTTLFHGTEVASWQRSQVQQHLDNHLFKSIPYSLRTFAVLEAKAEGVGTWFHSLVRTVIKSPHLGRWRLAFIPWYITREKYRLPAPKGWKPLPATYAHAKKVAETSARWAGRRIELELDQMYFWEREYQDALDKGTLHDFLSNYPAEPEEAFQSSTPTPFSAQALLRMSAGAYVPKKTAEWVDGRFTRADVDPDDPTVADDPRGIIWIWEAPKRVASYVIGVDTSRGIVNWSRHMRTENDHKVDNGVLSVWRIGERGEPDVQVAEFAGPIPGEDMAEIGNFLGRLYRGREEDMCTQIIETWPSSSGISYQERLYHEFGYHNLWRRIVSGSMQWARDFGWEANGKTLQDLWSRTLRRFQFFDGKRDKDNVFGGRMKTVVRSPWLIEEMRTCETDPEKMKGKAEYGCHDDRVRAAQLAIYGAHDWTTMDFFEEEEAKTMAEKRSGKHGDWQSRDYSVEDMHEAIDDLLAQVADK